MVYSLECKLCGEEYVGETRRTMRARLGEHHFQVRNKTEGTAWGDHMRRHHPTEKLDKEPVFFNAKILAVAPEDRNANGSCGKQLKLERPGLLLTSHEGGP